jgi:FAD/FMN-containing dehydrogenase
MTQTVGGDPDALRALMSGNVLAPYDGDYDEARGGMDAAIDRRPAVIARCTLVADVATAVTFGVQHGLEIAVRGGTQDLGQGRGGRRPDDRPERAELGG